MTPRFTREEYADRMARLTTRMAEEKLDALLLFAQESMYWLTGYDSFGFCFFQTLVVTADGRMTLLTRSPDLRQARQTSIIDNIAIWVDRAQADPTMDLKDLLVDLDLLGCRIGIEYDTHGMTGRNARLIDNQLSSFGKLVDASYLVSTLRLIKSPAEIALTEKAAALADDALDAVLPLIAPGADEAAILAAMQSAVLAGGGDYAANEFIIGSGTDALLCRYKSGRRRLDAQDQLTLEWAGVYGHYHAAMMRTVLIGAASQRHREIYAACRDAIAEMEAVLTPGHSFAEVFQRHAQVLETHGLTRHRLNACGYALGARFAPSWMEHQMFYAGNDEPILPGMVLFPHIIVMDSENGVAMTLGRTYLTTEADPRPLSRHGLDLIVQV
ncbi:Xaa-Pro peptidase family protein [Allorhizobium sp. BGMRC 0089]|uniref:M24 family metallopeptidase n=1 Tax=Allorhizobium sonneratiae TaxID=2934936 RepID=UPI0020347FC7|nr:Xaa-Pro peptidase family protein [Allorhizobium sonneratiae]MCM2291231.1 Xaa-Pro peptidase family protein [Allorhizobium sonneratiae]